MTILTDYMNQFPELNTVTVRIFQAIRNKINRKTSVDLDKELYDLIQEKYGHLINVIFVEEFEHSNAFTAASIEINGSHYIGIQRGPRAVSFLIEELEEVIAMYIED